MQQRKTVTLAEAALLTGKDKSTISKKLTHKDETKRIVGYKNNDDAWEIDVASLSSHYKIPTDNLNILEERGNNDSILNQPLNSIPRNTSFNSDSTHEIIELRAEVKFLHQQIQDNENRLNDKNKVIEDLREDRDHWKDSTKQAQETLAQQTRLLEHHQNKTPVEATEKPSEAQESDLATQDTTNDSKPPHGFLKQLYISSLAFIVMIMIFIGIGYATKSYWLPSEHWLYSLLSTSEELQE